MFTKDLQIQILDYLERFAAQGDSGRRLDDSRCGLGDSGCRLDDSDHRLDDSGCRLGDSGRKLDDSGRRLDDPGRRLDDPRRRLDIEEFASFILSHPPGKEAERKGTGETGRFRLDVDLSKNLTYLGRYIKYYLNKVVAGSALQTGDEYTYLMTLLQYESLNKTELNNLNVFEKTSGNEVIRRLARNGLVEEFDDVRDRRSRRVRITAKGREELELIVRNLRLASRILCHPLSCEEKSSLNDFLERILKVHEEVFHNHRNASLDEISELFPEKG